MKRHLLPRSRGRAWLLILGIFFGLLIIISIYAMARFDRIEAKKPRTLGVTFSQVQAERFGSDWRANYDALLRDLGFRHLRIVAYWDRTEPAPGNYDFSDTDWMIAEAAKYGAHVTLVVGQRTLRYPECYYPSWVNKNDPAEVSREVNAYIVATAEHYRRETTIESWQLENEFLLQAFGQCPAANLSSRELKLELSTLRRSDSGSGRPIIITQSDEYGFPIFGPLADSYGMSMYKIEWNQITHHGYIEYPQGGWFNFWRASLISLFGRTGVQVGELQAEPWGPVGNENLTPVEMARSMNVTQLQRNVSFAEATHMRDINLWGAEWWWYMKVHYHDPTMWQAVKALPHKD